MYYHGVFVASNVSLMDEIAPLLRKLEKHLKDNPFYLTPELIEILEEACKAKMGTKKSKNIIGLELLGSKNIDSSSSSSTSSSSSSSSSSEEDNGQDKMINPSASQLAFNNSMAKENLEASLRVNELEEIEKLSRQHALERQNIIDRHQMALNTLDLTNEELEKLNSDLHSDLADLDRRHNLEMESLLGSLAGRRVAELEALKAKSPKKGSDWTIDDKNSIYKDLEELARLQDALLKEMEGYEDYEEPNNEDLANKLKDLKFEVGLAKEAEEILEESNERKRRRKKDKKSKAQLELEDDIEANRVFNELEEAIMKAEAEGRIDCSERDRLLAELEELKKKQEDEARMKREQQQKLLQARLLQKRLQGKKTSSEQQNASDNSQATGTDNQAMMMLAENEAVIKENDAFESLKMELDLEIDAFEKQAEAELQALEAEYKNELEKNPSSEEAARLLADLEARKKEIEERRKRQLKAALAARNAKLAMAKKRKETAESEALLQSANSTSGQGQDKTSEKEAILEAVTNGEQLEDAIYKVLRHDLYFDFFLQMSARRYITERLPGNHMISAIVR